MKTNHIKSRHYLAGMIRAHGTVGYEAGLFSHKEVEALNAAVEFVLQTYDYEALVELAASVSRVLEDHMLYLSQL